MASGGSAVDPKDARDTQSSSTNVSVILRVKRKREEDPLDALVISHRKLQKLDSSRSSDGVTGKSVFCFAATSNEKEQSHEKIMDHIRQSQLKQNPLAKLSLSDRHSRMREQHKVESANKRYKLVSKLRALPEEKSSGEQNESHLGTDRREVLAESRLASLDHKANLHIKSDSKDGSSNIKDYLKEMVQFYDVEQQDVSDSDEESPEAIWTCSRTTATVITCNGNEMIREQCALNGKEEYMYDWYYLSQCPKEDVDHFNWESLEAYWEQPQLVHDILDDSDHECFDDEDDENEESNWRNDYPDEDEWRSDTSSGYEMSSENECYRYQPIGKLDTMDYDSEDSSQENY